MPTLREYLQSLSPSTKKKPNQTLMQEMRKELSAEQPDYSLCLEAFSMFRSPVVSMFYSDVYPVLSQSVQKEWNQAFLKWADSRPPKAKQETAFLRMSQAIKARLEQMEKADELSLEIQWFIAHFADNSARAISDAREMRDKTSAEQLRKLLLLPVENWSVDKESLKIFFDILFADFPAEHLEKEYRMFLMRTGLDSNSLPVKAKAHEAEETPSVQASASAKTEETTPVPPEKEVSSIPKTSAEQGVPASFDAESPAWNITSNQAAPSETEHKAEAETSTEIPAQQAALETFPFKTAENAAQQPQSSGTSGKASEPGFIKESLLAQCWFIAY